MTLCPSLSPGRAARFSARVLPAGRLSTQTTVCVWADRPRALVGLLGLLLGFCLQEGSAQADHSVSFHISFGVLSGPVAVE